MKVVVRKDTDSMVELHKVVGSKLYAYRSVKGTLFILSKLGDTWGQSKYGEYHFGFVNVGITNENPSFKADTMLESIEKAMNHGRKVFEFNNLKELLEWKLNVNND